MLELTKSYIKAFNEKNLNTIASLVDEQFILEDPAVKHLEGKNACLKAINSLYLAQ
ncbi:nuclear transport factor 2 family protein [Campylobacter sp. MIT 97-5078]|uniref:nuclear transport factor 2 family protein n=1 Tax=Campylobacter sp. MIT 97-5078 TaxID=1548153 RepID=UPI000AB186B1|nr:nuclear transport factor 2 family protein [Campylobacter sp. MIT 97-5078]